MHYHKSRKYKNISLNKKLHAELTECKTKIYRQKEPLF